MAQKDAQLSALAAAKAALEERLSGEQNGAAILAVANVNSESFVF